jgi:DNA polymerase-1
LFSSVDYDAAELRSLSQVLLWTVGWSRMAEFYQKDPNGDPHLQMAAVMLGITPEEAQARKDAGDPEIKKARQNAKAANFGLSGGLGIKKFCDYARKSYGVVISENQAKTVKEQWLNTWPEMRKYFEIISQRSERGSFTMMQLAPEGRKHRYRGCVGYTDGANGYFQGLAADGAKEALCRISYECYVDRTSPLFGSRVVGFFHDETFLEVPEDCAHEAATRQTELMISGMRAWLPDVPVTCSPALQRRWLKSAEPLYVNGRLVPWEPK